ncbi:hypothetical protein CDD83_11023 [Cordyceps sp. RAO-2017]|nr:hypothetical protein CDD83_11023 [Cordyceps sp. RAO-2017]
MVVATAPLLKPRPWTVLHTELLIKRQADLPQRAFDGLLCGHAPTVSLLLGISPVHFWTNAKSESHVDELLFGFVAKSDDKDRETQLHNRLCWKRDDQFSGQPDGRGRVHVDVQTACRLLLHVYLQMFRDENHAERLGALSGVAPGRATAYAHFHRGSFAVFLKLVKDRIRTDWPQVCSRLLDAIAQDRTLAFSSNYLQELCAQMHLQGVSTEPCLLNEVKPRPDAGPLKGWTDLPPVVAVTLVVPRPALDRLYTKSFKMKLASPTLVASLRAGPSATNQWHNMYSDVHITMGNVKPGPATDGTAAALVVEADELGWEGSSPLVASFVVPTASLQVEPTSALIGLSVPPSEYSTMLYGPILGMSMSLFETTLGDDKRVFVSRLMPGQDGHRIACGGVAPFEDTVGEARRDLKVKIAAEVPASESSVSTLTGRVEIASAKGRGLLRDKVPIELRQQDPFLIDVVFGRNQLVCPLRFPVPVTTTSSKTRIARTSGYVEVVAPLADSIASESLYDFIYPSRLSPAGLPVALNAPHVSLDKLPVLNLDNKDEIQWLVTLTSLQFSAREKRLRETNKSDSGIVENPRVNFKESLFTMFMLTAGLQGGQTGLFAINHPQRGGIHMLILVSALRLDGDAASVVLDAAVIPLTEEIVTSEGMHPFLLVVQSLECGAINVNDAELVLWKRVLPSLAERCRTWSHLAGCEYRRKGASVPLSVEPAEQVLCSCGNGKLPKDFVSMPEWEAAAPHAVRIAISPTYAVPFIEDALDPDVATRSWASRPQTDRCRSCGKEKASDGGALKKCTKCLQVKYCSVECQKKDWKKHRIECKEGS